MKSYLYLILGGICLGTIGTLIKLISPEVHFMTLSSIRLIIGFLALLLIVPFMDKCTFKISKKEAKDYFFVGLLMAIAFTLFNTANMFAPVQNAVLLNSFHPFFVLFFAYFLLKEKITRTKVITLIIALTGMWIINPFSSGQYLTGNLLAILSAVFAAMLTIEMRKQNKIHGIGDVLWFMFFAALILSPAPFIFGMNGVSTSLDYIIALGIISTAFAYLFLNLALENIEAEITSLVLIIIVPLTSIILATLVIHESISLRTLMGGSILLFAGIYLEQHKCKRKEITKINPHRQ